MFESKLSSFYLLIFSGETKGDSSKSFNALHFDMSLLPLSYPSQSKSKRSTVVVHDLVIIGHELSLLYRTVGLDEKG